MKLCETNHRSGSIERFHFIFNCKRTTNIRQSNRTDVGEIFFAYQYDFDLCNLHSYTTENDFILIAQNMKENLMNLENCEKSFISTMNIKLN